MKIFSVLVLTGMAMYFYGKAEPISDCKLRPEYIVSEVDTIGQPVDSIIISRVDADEVLDEVRAVDFTEIISAPARVRTGEQQVDDGAISIRGSRNKTMYGYDGIKINKPEIMIPQSQVEVMDSRVSKNGIVKNQTMNLPTANISVLAAKSTGIHISDMKYGEAVSSMIDANKPVLNNEIKLSGVKESEAGILTAAEWNDLNNWTDWKELTEDGVYTSMLDYWQLPMGKRESVFVINNNGIPLPNCQVDLLNTKGEVLWQSVSDHNGRAEVWQPIVAIGTELIIRSIDEVKVQLLENNRQYAETNITMEEECLPYNEIDIMFVVDATGSMVDEITYLKAELSDVVSRVTANQNVHVRTGSVFYKDEWDDYLTSVSHLNDDAEATVQFMSRQSISGGGDYPEAMEEGLGKALEEDWNTEALSRIIFLLLDAPPHDDPEVMERLELQVRKAAQLGIKIIPITASGINRETEYLMKQMAMMTNGTYVFLTDDSGVGESHMVHAIPDYEVEQLNDLLVRLIGSYSSQVSCDSHLENNRVAESIDENSDEIEMTMYPNPAHEKVIVKTSEPIDKIVLSSSTGKRLLTKSAKGDKELFFDVEDLVGGIYVVSFIKDGKVIRSQQLIVMH